MNKETVKLIKWAISLFITLGLVIVAAKTCPNEKMHKEVVTETIKKEIKRKYDLYKEEGNVIANWLISGVSSVESLTIVSDVNKKLIVDDFWLFSTGSMTDSNGVHLVSLGVFDHVFVFPLYVKTFIETLAEDE